VHGALAERLAGDATISFAAFVELALYDPVDGFYAGGGRAGRRGDFLTSPEVGPLFGALIARALDAEWERVGRPDPFVVVDAGAGPGTLARTVRVAEPGCGPSLSYLLVERSAAQRAHHGEHLPGWEGERAGDDLLAAVSTPTRGRGPVFASSATMPERLGSGVVVANELLDNLPFDVVRPSGGGAERMAVAWRDGRVEAVVEPAPHDVAEALGTLGVPPGAWVPWQATARAWVARALGAVGAGRLVVVDYGAPTADLAARSAMSWLRTYRGHERGGHPLDAPGSQDITSDVALDQLQLDRPATRVRTQAEWLHDLGIDELVEEGRRRWAAAAHAPDLAAIRARSRVREAEALTEPEGLGGFTVLEWEVGARRDR